MNEQASLTCIHSFNGGNVAFAQSCFAGRPTTIFFCPNCPDVSFSMNEAEIIRLADNSVIQKARLAPLKESVTEAYEIVCQIDEPGRYYIRVTDDSRDTHDITFTVLPPIPADNDNPFLLKKDKYSKISMIYFDILRYFSFPDEKILEAGSSTGHFTLEMGKRGYQDVSIMDVRPGPIGKAAKNFSDHGVKASFHVGDFLEHGESYDFIWNTGLFCSGFPDDVKEAFIKKAASLAPRLLVICGDNIRRYPGLSEKAKRIERGSLPRGGDPKMPVGVGAAITYPGINVPEIFSRHFDCVYTGMITQDEGYPGSERFWTYGENISKFRV